ncbi:hypothetical protein, partial [Ralstonia pseudosolanacearum]|uniref:hypothetical protein n=1 Tax=Ralstonia pseudosolanacearum TaxID=1310165 RepID=UPI0026758FA4
RYLLSKRYQTPTQYICHVLTERDTSVGVFCVWLTRTAASIEQCETKHGCRHMLCAATVPFVVALAALCLFRGVL